MNTDLALPALEPYTEPVQQLMQAGDCRDHAVFSYDPATWSRYLDQYNLHEAHIADLIAVIENCVLKTEWGIDEGILFWSPIHAWRALSQLKATAAIPTLIRLLQQAGDWEWVIEEVPRVLGLIGPEAIEPVRQSLAMCELKPHVRNILYQSLRWIADTDPESRSLCIEPMALALEQGQEDPITQGLIVAHLLDLKAVESIESIRHAYQAGTVDLCVCGDLEDVEIALGLRETRSTPKPRYVWNKFFQPFPGEPKQDAMPVPKPPPASAMEVPSVRKKAKVGRNDPCACGSGKKYKKCCLK